MYPPSFFIIFILINFSCAGFTVSYYKKPPPPRTIPAVLFPIKIYGDGGGVERFFVGKGGGGIDSGFVDEGGVFVGGGGAVLVVV